MSEDDYFLLQTEKEKLTCKDRCPAYMTNLVMMLLMVSLSLSLKYTFIIRTNYTKYWIKDSWYYNYIRWSQSDFKFNAFFDWVVNSYLFLTLSPCKVLTHGPYFLCLVESHVEIVLHPHPIIKNEISLTPFYAHYVVHWVSYRDSYWFSCTVYCRV